MFGIPDVTIGTSDPSRDPSEADGAAESEERPALQPRKPKKSMIMAFHGIAHGGFQSRKDIMIDWEEKYKMRRREDAGFLKMCFDLFAEEVTSTDENKATVPSKIFNDHVSQDSFLRGRNIVKALDSIGAGLTTKEVEAFILKSNGRLSFDDFLALAYRKDTYLRNEWAMLMQDDSR